MATIGQRGKLAEKQVKDWLTRRSDAEAGFWFYRYPDARAGSMQVVPADFGAVHRGVPYLVEVKEVHTEAASRRLAAKNFSADKVARMVKFHLAGGGSWVLVCHLPAKEWRLVQIALFAGERPASWDLSHIVPFPSAAAALEQLFGRL